MKPWLKHGALALFVLGVLGGLVMISGIVPITASSGHWPVTSALLQFSKERSVSTHSFGIKPPPLDQPHRIIAGAAYFDIGCRPCHGGPRVRQPRVAARMTPPAVYLPPRIANWDAAELFYIVKHGIKFTGMPAWPGLHRDDEVWSVVAFLRRLPALDAAQYASLTQGETGAPLGALALTTDSARRAVSESCIRCHGADGLGRGGAAPVIAGQQPAYIFAALDAYSRGRRPSGMMEPIAAGLSVQTMSELAHYYARLSRDSRSASRDSAAVARGRAIALGGVPQKKIPACSECHGPGARRRNPFYPDLAGQHADYLVLQLELFKAGKRGGTSYAHLMQQVAPHLSQEQVGDVAAYYSSISKLETRN